MCSSNMYCFCSFMIETYYCSLACRSSFFLHSYKIRVRKTLFIKYRVENNRMIVTDFLEVFERLEIVSLFLDQTDQVVVERIEAGFALQFTILNLEHNLIKNGSNMTVGCLNHIYMNFFFYFS